MGKLKAKNFNLAHTLECGQIFRYEPIDGFYYVVTGDKVLKLKQQGNDLFYSSNSDEVDDKFIMRFFRLDDDYDKIIEAISKDSNVAAAVKKYSGLRLIRQEPFECLISYICSAASNIPRIKKNIEAIAERFGEKIDYDRKTFYSFPEKLGDAEKIGCCGVGFRKEYIHKTAEIINKDKAYFAKLKKLSYEEAKAELKKLPGVADKVADCVLLFSLGFDEAFPVDTWVRKTMRELYFNNKNVSDSEIRAFAKEHFGKYAGYAQQFLFYSRRALKAKSRKI